MVCKQELEDKILRLLKEAKGNILDDELLINTLNNSKLTAAMIQNRVRQAEETENNINQVCTRWHGLPALSCRHQAAVCLCPWVTFTGGQHHYPLASNAVPVLAAIAEECSVLLAGLSLNGYTADNAALMHHCSQS